MKITRTGDRYVTAVTIHVPGSKMEKLVVELRVSRSTLAAVLDPDIQWRERGSAEVTTIY